MTHNLENIIYKFWELILYLLMTDTLLIFVFDNYYEFHSIGSILYRIVILNMQANIL